MGFVKLSDITVVRMDDVIFTYPDATFSVNSNVLHITLYDPVTNAVKGQHRHPLFNVWDWYADEPAGS